MNIALLTAGGSGTRMGMDIPKQFLTVYDKPIIVYTLERFQKHPAIDKIIVACKEGWFDILNSYIKQYGLTKVEKVVLGGKTGQESIKNMLVAARELHNDDDIILTHDGVRPMVSADLISNCISSCKENGNGVCAIPCREAMLITENSDDKTSNKQISRDNLKRTQTPHAFRLGDALAMHEEEEKRGVTNAIALCSMAIDLGKTVYFTDGSEKNLKITTKDDIDIFKALIKLENDDVS